MLNYNVFVFRNLECVLRGLEKIQKQTPGIVVLVLSFRGNVFRNSEISVSILGHLYIWRGDVVVHHMPCVRFNGTLAPWVVGKRALEKRDRRGSRYRKASKIDRMVCICLHESRTRHPTPEPKPKPEPEPEPEPEPNNPKPNPKPEPEPEPD